MIIIALGSNLRPRRSSLEAAILSIQKINGANVIKRSAIYANPALVTSPQDQNSHLPFLNMAISIEYDHSPQQLLEELQKIERQLGRRKSDRWQPRPIDLDIIIFNEFQCRTDRLTIPHQSWQQRNFVNAPLIDLLSQSQCDNEKWQLYLKTHRKTNMNLPQFMHILNLTPDSFSDGQPQRIEDWQQTLSELQKNTIAYIDIGAESTRPGATVVDADLEWARLHPFLDFIAKENLNNVKLSLDTYKPVVARQALKHQVSCINDVSGLADPEMISLLKDSNCEYVLMHSLSVPADKNKTLREDVPPTEQLLEWFEQKLEVLDRSGIHHSRIYLDPGLGFGKTAQQSLQIIQNIEQFQRFPCRILVGASRKSMMNLFCDKNFSQRDPESIATSLYLAQKGVNTIRVHNAPKHARAYLSWLHMNENVALP